MAHRSWLMGSVSALAMTLMVLPAMAQDNTDSSDSVSDSSLETVVVTGIRASLKSAQAIKQNSEQVVDSITAVDIGALPDNSVAEALQRVPGIQISRTDQQKDPLRWAGYGNGVFIRGLSWVNSLTNGHETFGAENGRTISFADISSDLMAGVDVYKNPDAKMIEGGVGGTINLRTRRPFDREGEVFAMSGNLGYGTLSDEMTPSINMLYSNRWKTKYGEVGFLFSADYQNMRTANNIVSIEPYNGTSTVDGETVYYPYDDIQDNRGLIGYRHMDWKQPRVSFDATLQWRPTEQLELTWIAIYSKAEPQSAEHNVAWRINNDDESLSSYNYDSNGLWIGGTIYNAETGSSNANYDDVRFEARHHMNGDYSFNAKYNPNDNLQVTIDAQYVDSRAYMYSMTSYYHIKNDSWCEYGLNSWSSSNCTNGTQGADGTTFYPDAPEINVSVDLHNDSPKITYSGDSSGLKDQSNYLWAANMDHVENNYAHSYATRADVTYTFDGYGLFDWIKSIDAGFRADLKQATTRHSKWNWKRTGFQTWNVGWKTAYDPDVYADAIGDFSTLNSSNTTYYKFGDVFGTKMPGMWEPKVGWLAKGADAVWKGIQEVESGLTSVGLDSEIWSPLSTQNGCTGVEYKCMAIYGNTSPTGNGGGVNEQSEDTFAGYVQFDYVHEDLFGLPLPVDGNVGVRIVATQTDSGEGYLMLPSLSSCSELSSSSSSTAVVDCDDRDEAYAFVGNDGESLKVTSAAYKNDYLDVLPSLNFRAHFTDTLQVRFAFSEGIVRPAFAKTQNYTSLSYSFQSGTGRGTFSETSGGKTGSGGNPYLKPMHANNYDVSLEWFFAPTGNLSVAFFYKDVKDYFKSATASESFTRNDITEDFAVTRYVNGGKGRVKGFEIAYQQFYDMLPGAWSGLGIQANYTKIYNFGGHNSAEDISEDSGLSYSNDDDLPMEGMSDDSYNATVMYEKYGISARVAWNWRSSFLVTSSATNLDQPVWQRAYGQLDTSLIYSFLQHYKIGIQAKNLLKQTTVLEVGDADFHNKYEWVEGERKVSLIFRANW